MHRAAFRRRAFHGRFPSMTAMIPPAALRAGSQPTRKQLEAEKHFQRGLQLMQASRWDDAARAFERAVQLHPGDPVVWLNLAQARRKAGKLGAAIDAARRARTLDPTLVVATRLEAACLSEQHRYAEAADLLGNLPVGRDDDPELHFARGYALLQQHRPQEAISPLMDALARNPGHIGAHVQLGNAFQLLALHEEAMQCFGTAALLEGDNPAYASAAMYEALHACKWDELPRMRAELDARLKKRSDIAAVPFMFLALSQSRAQQHAVACAYTRSQFGAIKPLPPAKPRTRPAGERIRLAYLSNDLHQHATAYLVAELFERHDRSRFEVTLYSYGIDDGSEMRRRLQRAADRFVDVARQSDREIAERIRADGIDILVDLKGYTRQARPAVLAYRPAPVQVNFLGYPGTMGPGLADYLIGDPVVTPLDHAADYSEKLALMPHSYQPNDRQRRIGPTPSREQCGLPAQGFVFCCFNNAYKITPEMFAIWCRLLNAVPGSVLWLLECSPQARNNLLKAAQAQGIEAARIVFAKPLPLADHLGRLRNADLVLDTLPYNAHTTASDALWAGVPIVTCPGETFASRVAASLCHAAGLVETVVGSLADYEALALRLARDPDRLRALRERLQVEGKDASLFDSARYAAHLEDLFERMHARALEGQAPEALRADPARAPSTPSRVLDAKEAPRREAGRAVPRVDVAFLGKSRGGGPRVAVVTPYYKERRAWLERCIESVKAQDYPVTHYMVADGFAQDWIDGAGVEHLKLGRGHADYGNTPRALGAQLAVSEGFDAICFLDADNWYAPDHVTRCLEAADSSEEAVDYVVARRNFVRDDGSVIPLAYDEDAAAARDGHIDTNCYFLLRGAFHTIPRWNLMPKPLAIVCDRVYRIVLESEKLKRAITDSATVNYLCTWKGPYLAIGETPPAFAKSHVDPTSYMRWWQSLNHTDKRFVERLLGAQISI
jgi:predicted O-linked N-acetylglucosamine transferase (SPINDLY family)